LQSQWCSKLDKKKRLINQNTSANEVMIREAKQSRVTVADDDE